MWRARWLAEGAPVADAGAARRAIWRILKVSRATRTWATWRGGIPQAGGGGVRCGGPCGRRLPALDSRSRGDVSRQRGRDARVAEVAREAGVPRVVYTSSVATMHFRTDGIVINEDTPVSLKDMVGHYKRSKFLAEQEAIAAAQVGQQVMILNPTSPIGSDDAKPTPTGRIFVDFLNGKFPAYMDTGLNLVDVAEVARAHVPR